uniref:PH domain-containing protein n=1 Tax=Macrostomum lignano TaxID=282301 RepID=A0A1I8JMD7_9PLAT
MPQFRGSYTKQRVLELISLSVQPVPGQPRALDLHSPQKSFRVVCNTAAEAEQWAQRIRLCSEDCRRRLGLSAGISPAARLRQSGCRTAPPRCACTARLPSLALLIGAIIAGAAAPLSARPAQIVPGCFPASAPLRSGCA